MADAQTSRTVSTVMVRQLDPAVVRKLRVRAAERGRSMETELRLLLTAIANGETVNG
jgi:plasmid stability protein